MPQSTPERLVDLTVLEKERKEAEKIFNGIKSVYCPFLNAEIVFSSAGFNHIRYKGSRKERHIGVQLLRYRLLKLAPQVLTSSHTLQEFCETQEFIEIKINKRRERVLKPCRYWGFIAIVKNRKVKVIVKKTGEGFYHFWSIIPNWITRKNRETKTFLNYTGNPEND